MQSHSWLKLLYVVDNAIEQLIIYNCYMLLTMQLNIWL